MQHVWLIAPPAERFRSMQSLKRDEREQRVREQQAREARRRPTDKPLDPNSRRGRKMEKFSTNWQIDSVLDEEHAANARGAA